MIQILVNILLLDGNQNAAADEAALRTMVTEINTKLAEREIEQRLIFVYYEWNEPIGEFLILCNTFSSVGWVQVLRFNLYYSIWSDFEISYN